MALMDREQESGMPWEDDDFFNLIAQLLLEYEEKEGLDLCRVLRCSRKIDGGYMGEFRAIHKGKTYSVVCVDTSAKHGGE